MRIAQASLAPTSVSPSARKYKTLFDFHSVSVSAEMQKVGDTGDISLLFFLAGANFWAILGNFWAILAILGNFWAILGNFGLFWVIFGSF